MFIRTRTSTITLVCNQQHFMQRVRVTDVCWEWVGTKDKDGYGCYTAKPYGLKNARAHRVSHLLFLGPIPGGMYVLHSCDNPACVNPEHLRYGNQYDNMDDMKKRGRSGILTPALIQSVRSTIGTDKHVADAHCVSRSTVWRIKHGLYSD